MDAYVCDAEAVYKTLIEKKISRVDAHIAQRPKLELSMV
jgi:hypothetical protein